MVQKLSQIGEFGLIGLFEKRAHLTKGVVKGIGDDTAVLVKDASKFLLFTTDMLVEGVHFKRSQDPEKIGHKAISCSISDIAAMGGEPKYALVSLGVPKDMKLNFIKDVYKGINKTAKKFDMSIVGGDTVQSKKIIISVSLMGEVKKKSLVTRSGAKKGDIVFVTGPLGRSLISGKHLNFLPRLKAAQFLVKSCKPSAMIDISDGLVADLKHILKASRVGAVIELDKVPKARGASLRQALNDGEDFELLFTVSKQKAKKLARVKGAALRFKPVGEIVEKKKRLQFVDSSGKQRRIITKGYRHF